MEVLLTEIDEPDKGLDVFPAGFRMDAIRLGDCFVMGGNYLSTNT
ncbi:hypothetical protein ACO2Q2_04580 [Dyella sp. KRB-257]